jgi:outer membrane protein OmpA-like peptidoglycan-associated protein
MKSHPTILRVLAGAALAACLFAGSAFAAEFNLSAITFPENTTVDVPMARTNATPNAATFAAAVKFSAGQARVKVAFRKMEPAILFGGDISSYVVWAVTRDGSVENLGELIVGESKASATYEYATPKKQFALMVTAEPYYLVGRPGELVVATSGSADPKKAPSASFAFKDFRPLAAKSDVGTIAGLTYKDKKLVVLVQAERALAVTERTGAAALSPTALEEARKALTQAQNSAKSGGNAKAVTDYSRRTVALSSEMMRDYGRKLEADEAARKRAELEKTQMTVVQLREAQAKLEADKARLLADQAQLQKEKAELEGRLKSSMALVGETRDSARGAVMSLPGISFETGKAVLKPAAQLTLAQLAGIAQVFPTVNLRVEGYTDSTGNAAANQKLSEARAKAVYDFLKTRGVADARLAFQGLGSANPVADNATAEGKAKNRRVEIVAAPGEIKPVGSN